MGVGGANAPAFQTIVDSWLLTTLRRVDKHLVGVRRPSASPRPRQPLWLSLLLVTLPALSLRWSTHVNSPPQVYRSPLVAPSKPPPAQAEKGAAIRWMQTAQAETVPRLDAAESAGCRHAKLQNVDAESVCLDHAVIMVYTVQRRHQRLYIGYEQAWIMH